MNNPECEHFDEGICCLGEGDVCDINKCLLVRRMSVELTAWRSGEFRTALGRKQRIVFNDEETAYIFEEIKDIETAVDALMAEGEE